MILDPINRKTPASHMSYVLSYECKTCRGVNAGKECNLLGAILQKMQPSADGGTITTMQEGPSEAMRCPAYRKKVSHISSWLPKETEVGCRQVALVRVQTLHQLKRGETLARVGSDGGECKGKGPSADDCILLGNQLRRLQLY